MVNCTWSPDSEWCVSEEIWIRRTSASDVIRALRDLYRYRRLIVFFGRQALLKFTRRTILGFLWLPIRCFAPYIGAAFVARAVLQIEGGAAPYLVFLFSGALPWTLFSTSAYWITRSLELNRRYIRSRHASILAYPAGFYSPALVNAGMIGALLVGLLVYHRYAPTLASLASPLSWLLITGADAMLLMQGATVGLLLCQLAMRTRDTRFTLGYALGALLLMTPIAYPVTAVSERWRWALENNPIAVAIETFRYGLLGVGELDPVRTAAVAAGSALAFACAVVFLVKTENSVKRYA